jgi:hypothetical protein
VVIVCGWLVSTQPQEEYEEVGGGGGGDDSATSSGSGELLETSQLDE